MLYAEDLAEGQQFQLGTYTISEDEIIRFATVYDPIPIHIDPVAAKSGPFGGVIASGLNTAAIYQRLIVEAVWSRVAGVVGRSLEIRLRHPVRPGDGITGQSTIRSVTLRPERRCDRDHRHRTRGRRSTRAVPGARRARTHAPGELTCAFGAVLGCRQACPAAFLPQW